MTTQPGHWSQVSHRWAQVGPPLRPSEQDLAVFQNVISEFNAPAALIMGVTPELYRLDWPKGTRLCAVDHTRQMIDTIWLGRNEEVVCGDWKDLPLRNASRDVALCDGGLHLNSYPAGQQLVAESLRHVLRPDGAAAIRLFVPPRHSETKEDVLRALCGHEIPNLNVLKLRLGMSMQRSPQEGTRLGDVWQAVRDTMASLEVLAEHLQWPLEHLTAIDTYRNSDARYCFVTPDEVERLFCKEVGGFILEEVVVPTYFLGERCPILKFRRR